MIGKTPDSDNAAMQAGGRAERAQAEETGETWGSFLRFLLTVALIALIFRSFVFTLFNIPSESMMPRLMNGDYLAASKWDYGFSKNSLPFDLPLGDGRLFASQPERGDVVIFKHPVDNSDYIKRVIGLPGDIVAVQGGVLVLNGERVPKIPLADALVPLSPNTSCNPGGEVAFGDNGLRYCRYKRFREELPGGPSYEVFDFGPFMVDDTEPVIVPEGTVFLMGDNRDNSQDSRFPARAGGGVGLVPQDLLVGKARLMVWSTDGSASWLKPWTWFSAARGDRLAEGI
ncbi:Signal peptidase I [Alteripontixanthobacter maritimus]|uniref:Signal peptidase I n=1 Tax=Alteripontixanthobacter maritimus TaxID=2161824 RepID=A0A369Q5D0_9SPHN|nr:signal peptidase I [Alteripontixanthobacter maritimus]RDC59630.1 Signal peptidase I [Alteripontixanthobacter maritimus]